jgi:O-acetyl-ADP-ribose deacetylase (regulator of RNase III)
MNIRILLRDKNIEIVNAWKSAFYDYDDVEVSCGNIFDLSADAIISPANSFGFMDGGIDLVYIRHFGNGLQEALQNIIRSEFYGEIPVGTARIVKTDDVKIKYLISAPTMRIPENVSTTVNAYLAFRASLVEDGKFNGANSGKISSILSPGLGTLTGMISPANCALQMKYAYDSIVKNKKTFPQNLQEAYLNHKRLLQN